MAIGDGDKLAVDVTSDAAVAMLADQELAILVDAEAIRSLLAKSRRGHRHSARLQKNLRLGRTRFPLVHDVLGHVGKHDGALEPRGAFGPVEALGELLDGCVRSDELIEG